MDQNMMTLLAALLSGRNQPLSGQPKQAQMQMPAMPAQQQPAAGQGYRTTTMMPMASERPDHGPNLPGDHDGGGNNGDGDKNGNGGGRNRNLSRFERKMREIGQKGPKAYPKYIEKNLDLNKPTIGYGKKEPSAFATGMATALTGIPAPSQPAQPASNTLPNWI